MIKKLIKGLNDLKTLNPELAKEWHPTKNGTLTPSDVTCGSNQKVWWLLPYDTEDGKHFDFEWQAKVNSRNKGAKCPYLCGKAIYKGFNDFESCYPILAKEWHPTKNGNLKPDMVSCLSGRKVWWQINYIDENGIVHILEWETKVHNRVNGKGCPYLSGNIILKGFNDLATRNPQLASEWHPTKNGTLTPSDVTIYSNQKVWWLLPYDTEDGKHFDFEWEATIYSRNNGSNCPYLSIPIQKLYKGFNDLVTTHPDIAKEWHPIKNGNLTPDMVTSGSKKKVWWLYKHIANDGNTYEFEWVATINSRVNGSNCPNLKNSKIEEFLNNFFRDNNINYISEYKFSDCKYKKVLPFDFYLSNENIVIECDGLQHFESIKYFGGEQKLKDTKIKDKIRNDYCKKNNIHILRIPYIYDVTKNKDKIVEIVLNFIKTKQIPKEIIDFYSKIK